MKLLILLIACSYLGVAEASTLKIVNYNVWHGLNGTGLWNFGELESAERREQRVVRQIEEFKKVDADIIFLQEVNPVYKLAKRYAEALNMDYVVQADQCGIKVLRFGPPFNLHTGLAILAKKSLHLEKLDGIKLSGERGFCGEWFGFQLKEFRYALLAKINLGDQEVSLINTHLHHGPAPTDKFIELLNDLVLKGEMTEDQKDTLISAMLNAEKRRLDELMNLKSALQPYKDQPAIIAADLNQTPGSDTLGMALELLPKGHVVYQYVDKPEEFLTWNPVLNSENYKITSGLVPPVPYFGIEKVRDALNELDRIERQIDYVLWFDGSYRWELINKPILFANEPDEQGLIQSDHFGIQVELELKDN